jgi:hypothetical protein
MASVTFVLALCVGFAAMEIGARRLWMWAAPKGVMYRKPIDDGAHMGYVLRAARNAPRDELQFVVIGGSTAREAFSLDPKVLAPLSEAAGRPVGLHKLTTASQSNWEAAVLLSKLDWNRDIVVLATLSGPKYFSRGFELRDFGKLPLSSAPIVRHLTPGGLRPPWSQAVAQRAWLRRFLIRRLISVPRGWNMRFAEHRHARSRPLELTLYRRTRHFSLIGSRESRDEHFQQNKAAMKAIVDFVAERGGHLFFLTPPRHVVEEEEWDKHQPGERALFEQLLEELEENHPIFDARSLAMFRPDDFKEDAAHLREPSARRRYTEAAIRLSLEYMAGRCAPARTPRPDRPVCEDVAAAALPWMSSE